MPIREISYIHFKMGRRGLIVGTRRGSPKLMALRKEHSQSLAALGMTGGRGAFTSETEKLLKLSIKYVDALRNETGLDIKSDVPSRELDAPQELYMPGALLLPRLAKHFG